MNGTFPVYERVVVISDLHLPPAERLGNFSAGERLAEWTTQQASSAPASAALVLAGDIVDFLLLEDRPRTLKLSTAALLAEESLRRLQDAHEWVGGWRSALRAWLERGGRIVLLPGNHDPEWFHPDAAVQFRRWITGSLESNQVDVWRGDGPWECQVGGWHAVVGHGHRGDAVNDIDPARIHAALRDGRESISLPPGSELVLGPVHRFKRAMDPKTDRRRFPFIDAIKPEAPGVLLLLLYLDPRLFFSELPPSLAPLAKALVRTMSRYLRSGPVLATPAGQATRKADGTPEMAELLASEMIAELATALSESERQAPDAILFQLQSYLESGPPPEMGGQTLASHGGLRKKFLRAWLRREQATSATFFRADVPSQFDRGIIEEHLPEGCGPKVVIIGHTHAARDVRLSGDRVYLNTGTWTNLLDLSQFKDTDENLSTLIDVLESGTLPQFDFKRLTWAEVTPAGPALKYA